MANLVINSVIDQIKEQNMVLVVESEERFIDESYSLFEDEEINVDVNMEIEVENHSEYGKSVKKLKVSFLNAYDNRECEDLTINDLEKREIENYLKENLIIKIL
ncbi:hypothetical protein PFY12_14735 [Chryseobacterium camelliae]|uniref:Uncharacterized protein n=1 Tax=Chryseobacterium camelliae TaxID=1265445 RepID=A0ABY7QMS6_9FLAO|nr:hypothetical protein [Chryseobacterium camelliae]WBV60282.1 hypothetical protein PFY12_14735 [Chryseobacterium camelliae]